MAERESDKQRYIFQVPPLPMPNLKGLGSTYFYKMQAFKDKIAQTDAFTGEQQTYELVLQKSIRAAIVMRNKGLKPKDVITICSYNHLDALIPYYASLFLGVLSANLDPALTLPDCVHLLKQVCPKMIFVVPDAVRLMEDSCLKAGIDSIIVVFGQDNKRITFSDFLVPSLDERIFKPYEVENLKETATIVFSSGSSGLPKGICLTHYGLLGCAYNGMVLVPGASTFLLYANLFWISSPFFTVPIILNGLNRLVVSTFQAESVWDLITQFKVNIMVLNSHQAAVISNNSRPVKANSLSLQRIFFGGGPISKDLVLSLRKCFPGTLVLSCYGQTEQSGVAMGFRTDNLTNDMQWFDRKLDSCGKPQPGNTYKIVDPETEEILGPNKEGELRIKSDFFMKGYYNMDSSEAWDSDGFLKTGDVAYYDNDHCFYIVDRIMNLMKYKMWHISPARLEAIFNTHPAVQTVVVTGKPHPIDGDHIVGLVILNDNAVGKVSEDELRKYVDDKVGEYQKLRGGVKIIKEIPVSLSGKFLRTKLRDLLVNGKI